MKIKYLYTTLLLSCWASNAQSDIDLLLKRYNDRSVPYISVQNLKDSLENYLILDTRKKDEYDVSHIPNAIWASQTVHDSLIAYTQERKEQPIVVYCSVGIRSENFGKELKMNGFTNVKNLYGSIFAWKDEGYKVVNRCNKPTDSIHIFSKTWGKYLNSGIKVY